jgi:DNA-binding NarL/FixJ family response regulator
MEELNVTDKTVLFHFRKLKKVYPDLELTRDSINSYNTVRTDSIQRLLREGKTVEQISGIMHIKEESVKCNIRRYKKKMIVKSKAIKPSVDHSTIAYIAERLQNQIKTV